MQNRTFLITGTFVLLSLAACKKDAAKTTSTPSIWGEMVATKVVDNGWGDTTNTYYDATANFTDASDNPLFAGNVSINDTLLDTASTMSGFSYTHGSTVAFSITEPIVWKVTGSGTVPTINYTVPDPFPAFSGSLPTDIDSSAGFTIPISGYVTGADSVFLYVSEGTYSVAPLIRCATTVNAITVTSTQLSILHNRYAYIYLLAIKNNIARFGDKDYSFVTECGINRGAPLH